MQGNTKWLHAVLFAVCCAVPVRAEWERTMKAFDTALPDPGKLQVSLIGGHTAFEIEGPAGAGDLDGDQTDALLYLNYGLTEDLNIIVSPILSRLHVDSFGSETGIGDTYVYSTYRINRESEESAGLAVQGRLSLPTGDEDDGLGSDKVEPGVLLIASTTHGALTLVGNIGGDYVIDAEDEQEDFIFRAAVEASYAVSEAASLNGVLRGATARADGGEELVDFGVGGRAYPNESSYVTASFYLGLSDAYDWAVEAGGGYEF